MVVFFDIDGTIIDEKTQQIPASCIRAIEKLAANGHTAVVNTGRPYGHIDPRIYGMAFQAYVCACGMEVRLDNRRIHYAYPDAAQRRYAVDMVRKHAMLPIYEDSAKLVIMDSRADDHPYIRKERITMAKKNCRILDAAEEADFPFQKFVTFDGSLSRREDFIKDISREYDVIVREGSLLEMVMKGASKASGMQILLDAIGETRENTLAIGDSNNDLPMFRFARHTACMGAAAEDLKAACEFVTDEVLSDGIEKALQHFGLID